MEKDYFTQTLTDTVKVLSQSDSLNGLCLQHRDSHPLPSGETLKEVIALARAILFPGYYGESTINAKTISYHIGVNMERLQKLLEEQIFAALCIADCSEQIDTEVTLARQKKVEMLATKFMMRLPAIREMLGKDIEAAYNGDPAAESLVEIICCYPALKALINYRLAHELYLLEVPLIPRMMSEQAHSETGIDIHPGATIGEYFTIDHGTGVVIGATCIIGNNVKLYQGVTLGAKSFPLDKAGNPIKGIPRHPIIGDNVVIYSNATVLGRITIGSDCVIGANTWVQDDMRPKTKKYKKIKKDSLDIQYNNGSGI